MVTRSAHGPGDDDHPKMVSRSAHGPGDDDHPKMAARFAHGPGDDGMDTRHRSSTSILLTVFKIIQRCSLRLLLEHLTALTEMMTTLRPRRVLQNALHTRKLEAQLHLRLSPLGHQRRSQRVTPHHPSSSVRHRPQNHPCRQCRTYILHSSLQSTDKTRGMPGMRLSRRSPQAPKASMPPMPYVHPT
jgi:hypothetical protein